MPRIPDSYLENVFYLYPDDAHARESRKAGGTGFFVLSMLPSGIDGIVYAVTNRHVVEHGNTTMRLTTLDHKLDTIETPERDWIFHPDKSIDLAVLPIRLAGQNLRYKVWPVDRLVTHDLISKLDIGCGDECFTVGRFVNRDGRVRNTPTTRMGNIAQFPSDENHRFLVEMRTIGGASGSPVYFYRPPASPPIGGSMFGKDSLVNYTGPFLLGVNEKYVPDRIQVGLDGTISDHAAIFNTGMMEAVPAWLLLDIIDSDHQKALRAAYDRQLSASVGKFFSESE